MPKVEVYGKDEMKPLFEGDFAFMPRLGETISKDAGGYVPLLQGRRNLASRGG